MPTGCWPIKGGPFGSPTGCWHAKGGPFGSPTGCWPIKGGPFSRPTGCWPAKGGLFWGPTGCWPAKGGLFWSPTGCAVKKAAPLAPFLTARSKRRPVFHSSWVRGEKGGLFFTILSCAVKTAPPLARRHPVRLRFLAFRSSPLDFSSTAPYVCRPKNHRPYSILCVYTSCAQPPG